MKHLSTSTLYKRDKGLCPQPDKPEFALLPIYLLPFAIIDNYLAFYSAVFTAYF